MVKNMTNKLDISQIKWIFFDVGSTIVDETQAYSHRAYDMLNGSNITFDEFDRKRIELSKQGYDGNSQAIKYFGLSKTPWHHEDEKLYESAKGILLYLKNKGYHLGIIANQSKGLTDRLRKFDVFDYFELIISSEDVGLAKPDTKIFQHALERIGCTPNQVIMIGDRLDNDIIPAKLVGMNTMWIRHGLSIYQDVTFGSGVADFVIDRLQSIELLL